MIKHEKLFKIIIVMSIFLLSTLAIQTSFAENVTISNTTTGGLKEQLKNESIGNNGTIFLNSGTYSGNNNTNITIKRNITIQGNGSTDKIILDGQGKNKIFIIGDNINVMFINMTFINGYSKDYGGAIDNPYGSTIMFINCIFINNRANIGGAIWNNGTSFMINNSTFISNSASVGGAIWSKGANFSINNSKFYNNIASDHSGAIYNIESDNFSISNTEFNNNKAGRHGGAINNDKGFGFYIYNSTFTNNIAAWDGGAIYILHGGNISIINSTFTNNSAEFGGAIYNRNGSNFYINSSIFKNNIVKYDGGAIYNIFGTDLLLANSTFNNNYADYFGGAISNLRANNSSIKNSTFKDNCAKYGGAALYTYYNLDFSIDNSTFTDNIAHSGAIYNENSTLKLDRNTFIGNNSGNITSQNDVKFSYTNLAITTNFNSNKLTISVTATTSTGEKIQGALIYFYINGKQVATARTNNNGVAIYIHTISTAGRYDLLVELKEQINIISKQENFYFTSNSTEPVTVLKVDYIDNTANNTKSKIKSSLIINNFQALFKKSNTIRAILRDKNGKVLSGKQVNFYVNGKLIGKSKTNSKGVASIKYIFKTRKSHKIHAKFGGDKASSASNSKTLTLTPKDKTYTSLAKIKVPKNKRITFKATLKNKNKKALRNTFLKFYADNKYLGKAKTNSKGIATLTRKITKKGMMNFLAKYAGSKNFHSSSAIVRVTIK